MKKTMKTKKNLPAYHAALFEAEDAVQIRPSIVKTTLKPSEAKIYNTNGQSNWVTIEYYDLLADEEAEMTLTVPMSGGYVRFEDGKQACTGLQPMGNTLRFGEVDGDNFLKFIKEAFSHYCFILNKELNK